MFPIHNASQGLRPLTLILALALAGQSQADSPPSFRRDIAPILADRCVGCHGPEKQKGGYRVDSYNDLLTRGDSKEPPIIVNHAEASHLIRLLTTSDPADRMPQKGEPLDRETIEMIQRWIDAGAAFDGSEPGQPLAELVGAVAYPPPPAIYNFPVPILAVTFLGEDRIAVGGLREVTVWTLGGEMVRRIPGVPERVHALALHPQMRFLYFAGGTPGRSGAAGVIDLEGEASPQILLRTPDELLALALSGDGACLAVAGTDRAITVFDSATLARRGSMGGHADWVLDLAFSPDGQWLASASRDRTARVFEVDRATLVSAFRDHGDAVTAVAFVEEGKRVASAGRDGRIRTWEAATAKAAKASKAVAGEVTRLREHEGILWSAWTDGKVRKHRASDLESMEELAPAEDRILDLNLEGPTGVGVASTHGGEVRFWGITNSVAIHPFIAAPR